MEVAKLLIALSSYIPKNPDYPVIYKALQNCPYEGLHGGNHRKCLWLFKDVPVLQGPIFHASLLTHIFAYEGLK